MSASCLHLKWYSIWTVDQVSNFNEFKTTIPLGKTLNIKEHPNTNIGRQNEWCFAKDIENSQFVTLSQTYRKFKIESVLLQNYVTKANFRQGLFLNLLQLINNTLRSQNFVQKTLNWPIAKILKRKIGIGYINWSWQQLQKYHNITDMIWMTQRNRPFAAKPSRDLLFIKLWAATLRMPEMEKACRKHQNGQVWSPWH